MNTPTPATPAEGPKRSTIPLTLTPDSSKIHGYGYDPERKVLAVRFKNPKTKVPGPITYEYAEVPPEKFAEVEAAESKGSTINALFVKTAWGFERMQPAE